MDNFDKFNGPLKIFWSISIWQKWQIVIPKACRDALWVDTWDELIAMTKWNDAIVLIRWWDLANDLQWIVDYARSMWIDIK